ncbi:acid-sensing ion channel 1-like isoform X2 [Mizuhopecten yessoensis]|uniref:acid-sensing ion channel 1-like isoform X2 n=1 Tax=Mizuhopecten yessoensis TaxID=6573 RepID=UPI000B45E804|nr:acid-sensing ion channel 1-like isoform X2 [Mizuhopecten yessoensis]
MSEMPPPEVNETEPMPKEATKAGKLATLDSPTAGSDPETITLRERFQIFMNETSFTALTRIHKANSIIKRVIWFVVLLAMLAWLSIQCFWLLEKYFKYPVDVKIELVSVAKIEFPSVTICNRNPLRKSIIKNSPFRTMEDDFLKVKQDDSLYDKAYDMMFKKDKDQWNSSQSTEPTVTPGPNPNTNPSGPSQGSSAGTTESSSSATTESIISQMKEKNFNVWDALSDHETADYFYNKKSSDIMNTLAYSGFAAYIDESELEQYGHTIEDLLMSCTFEGYPCSTKNFTYLHNSKYGNCYTFNHHKNNLSAITSSYAGPLMGLVMEFNIEQGEYVESLAPEAGVRVLVHERGTFPIPDDDGFYIAPGFVSSVGIQEIQITRLPPPHASCADHGVKTNYYQEKFDTIYTKQPCLKSCYQDTIIARCDCAVPYYMIPAGASVCDVSNHSIANCLDSSIDNMVVCDTMCPDPCNERKYQPFVSMASWPSDAFSKSLEKRLMRSSTDFMEDDHLESKSKNLAKIEIFFKEMIYEKIEQQKGYESQNLISDIGGQLGLWLGLSAITIGELVEFFAAIFKAVTARAVRRKDREPAKVFRNIATHVARRSRDVSDNTRVESLTG